MSHSTARAYLLERFHSDALILRERATTLTSGTERPGPDAATSQLMAAACDDVVVMLQAIAPSEDAADDLRAIEALVPLLEERAQRQQLPAVRSVYHGAATRIREVRAATDRAATGGDS